MKRSTRSKLAASTVIAGLALLAPIGATPASAVYDDLPIIDPIDVVAGGAWGVIRQYFNPDSTQCVKVDTNTPAGVIGIDKCPWILPKNPGDILP